MGKAPNDLVKFMKGVNCEIVEEVATYEVFMVIVKIKGRFYLITTSWDDTPATMAEFDTRGEAVTAICTALDNEVRDGGEV